MYIMARVYSTCGRENRVSVLSAAPGQELLWIHIRPDGITLHGQLQPEV